MFISSWMNQPLESIAMWKLYSNMSSGIRIGLQRYPFVSYTATKEDIQNMFPNVKVNGTHIDLIAPIEECFNDKYFIINCAYEQSLEKVEYKDDPKRLSPKIFTIGNKKIKLASAELGKYKNTYWEFQNEERYVLRFLPIDAKQMFSPVINAAGVVYKAFNDIGVFLPYFDLKLRDDAFYSMEITLSPQFSYGNRVILECLREKYNPNMKIFESALKNRVKL